MEFLLDRILTFDRIMIAASGLGNVKERSARGYCLLKGLSIPHCRVFGFELPEQVSVGVACTSSGRHPNTLSRRRAYKEKMKLCHNNGIAR